MLLVFENEYDENFNEYETIYENLMIKAFEHLNIKADYEVDVNLVNNETIHEINKEYRKIDRPTDVISFAFLDEIDGEVKIKGDVKTLLGEIIISVDKAKEQAEEYGHSLIREMSFLFVHGLLHLLGYDHMKKEDEEVMFGLQEEILKLGGQKND
ncbi:MAG: rRNA maturation RNase YbeY [Erysipelotrichales bacterium]|nr:rRNA maturation RNase YbeY [Erysipelotrichales bacterium]